MLDKFHVVRRDDVTAVTSGRLVLDGDIGAPRVEGRFTTETVEISLLTDLPPTVVTLDVVEVKNGVVQAQPPAAEEPPPIDALLDIVEIGRASCRERVCPYVLITVVGASLKKKKKNT